MNDVVYTIGHSTHSTQKLIRLLSTHEITAVVDVRSQPYSRMNPQFNKENLKEVLNAAGIAYVFLGRQLGARTDDDSCYVDGKGVAGSFGLSREQVLERKTHQEPFQLTVYLLRRMVNLSRREVALMTGISPSRVSHIQKRFENPRASSLPAQTRRWLQQCKVTC